MAQLVIAAAGAAIGGWLAPGALIFGITGAQVGWAIGSMVGAAAFSGGADVQGPRLDDLRVTGTEYGAPIPWVRGAPRMAGMLWWASDKRETRTESDAGKGGGPTVTTFTYDMDLLIGLTDCDLAGITRVWKNGDLVYTARSSSDAASLAASDQTDLWRRITFYSGSATQLPDPTYEAAVGSDLAPGYRGRAYIFIEGLQLGQSGQIPNLTFEVARTVDLSGSSKNSLMGSIVTASTPYSEEYVLAVHADSSGDAYFYVGSSDAARVVKVTSAGVASFIGTIAYNRADLRSKGQTDQLASLGYINSGSGVYTYALYAGTTGAQSTKVVTTVANGFSTAPVWVLREGVLYVCREKGGGGSAVTTIFRFAAGASTPSLSYTPAQWCQSLAAGSDYLYALQDVANTSPATTDQIYVINATTMALVETINSPYSPTGQGTGRVLVNERNELFYVRGNGLSTNAWWRREAGAWVLVSSDLGSADPGNNSGGFLSQTAINSNTLYVARYNASDHSAVVYRANAIQDPGTETVRSVVEAVCQRAGMPSGTYDAAALDTITRPVRALAVAQVAPARQTLEQLMAAYFFESVLSDKLYFYPRGRSAVASIPFTDLAAGIDEAVREPLPLTVAADIESSAMVAVRYRNMNADQQVGVQLDDRSVAGQASLATLELSLGLLPSEAKIIAQAISADKLASMVSTEISLSRAYAHLEATDSVNVLSEDGLSAYRLRLVRRTDDGGLLRFEALADAAEVVTQLGQTDETDFSAMTVTALADTTFLALDMPILRDDDNSPGWYVAGRGSTANWPGGSIYASTDNVTFTAAAAIDESAVLGTCTTTLGNWSGGLVVDELNSVTVNVAHGTLSSITRDALLTSNDNTLLIGSEVIRFVDAVLQSANPNVYKCTRLLRGLRGTEWAMTGHVASERVVLLRTAGLRRVSQQTGDLGQVRYVKGVTYATSVANVTAQSFTNTGIGLKPFAPVNLRGQRTSGGDMVLTWTRRTRLGTRIVGSSGMSAPLGEASEAYEVEFWDSTYATRKRTVTGLSAPTTTYSAADQVSDFGSIQATIYVRVYQVSATVGRGYVLQASAANTLPSYFEALTVNDEKSLTAGVGSVAILQRRGLSAGNSALGFYTLAVGGTPALSTFVQASASTPYLLGHFGNLAVNGAGEQVVMYLRAISNPQSLRRIVAGSPTALAQVADGSPGFMPTDPPAGIAWTGTKFVLITVTGRVYHSTDMTTWVYQGPMASGAPVFDPSPASFNIAVMRMIAGKLVMRYGSYVYYNTAADGISWSMATGAVASLPLGTYVNGFQLYALEASSAGDAGVIIGYGRDATNTVGGVVYYTADGVNWTELFNDEVAGPAWGGRSTTYNGGMVFYAGEFLTDLWPLIGGTASEDVLAVATAGSYPVKYNRRAAAGVATSGGLVAIGNGTTGFLADTLYTSADGLAWTSVTWSD